MSRAGQVAQPQGLILKTRDRVPRQAPVNVGKGLIVLLTSLTIILIINYIINY